MDKLQRLRTSWLTWAIQNDVERELQIEAMGITPAAARVETYEYGVVAELLAGIFAAAQQSEKPVFFPSPHTARDTIKRERAVAKVIELEAAADTVSDEEYQASPEYLAGLNEIRVGRGLPPLTELP